MDVHRKHLILEACHEDRVGGCHFGQDKTTEKISSRFFWKDLYKDVYREVGKYLPYYCW